MTVGNPAGRETENPYQGVSSDLGASVVAFIRLI